MSIMGQSGTEDPFRRKSPKQKEDMRKRTNGGDRKQQPCPSGNRETFENTTSASGVRKRSRSGERRSRHRSENNVTVHQTIKEKEKVSSNRTPKHQPKDEGHNRSRERSNMRKSDGRRPCSRDRSHGTRSSDVNQHSRRESSGSRRQSSKGNSREKESSDATRSSSGGRSGSRDRRRSSTGVSRERSDRHKNSRERSKGERSGTGAGENRRNSSRDRNRSSSETSRSKEKKKQRGGNVKRPDPLILLPTLLPARKKQQNEMSSSPSIKTSARGHMKEAEVQARSSITKDETRKEKSIERRQLTRSKSLLPPTNTKNDTMDEGMADKCNVLSSKDQSRVLQVRLCTDERVRGENKERDASFNHGTAWEAFSPSCHPSLSSNLINNKSKSNGTVKRKVPSTETRTTNGKGADKSEHAKRGDSRKEDFSCMTFATIEEWGNGGPGSGVKRSQKHPSTNLDSTGCNEKLQEVPSVVCLFRRNERISIVEEASVKSDITFRPSSLLPLNEPRIRRCKSLEPALQSNIAKKKPSDRYRRIKYVPKPQVQGT